MSYLSGTSMGRRAAALLVLMLVAGGLVAAFCGAGRFLVVADPLPRLAGGPAVDPHPTGHHQGLGPLAARSQAAVDQQSIEPLLAADASRPARRHPLNSPG